MTTAMIVFTNLALAVAQCETGNGGSAKGHYGPLQISMGVIMDLNSYFHTDYKPRHFVGNFELSAWAFEQYGKMNDCVTAEDYVRCWRGGKTGGKAKKYNDYTARVLSRYEAIEEGGARR